MTLVVIHPCVICHRDVDETSVRVSWWDGTVRDVCGICWEKADDYDERLDMTEDEE